MAGEGAAPNPFNGTGSGTAAPEEEQHEAAREATQQDDGGSTSGVEETQQDQAQGCNPFDTPEDRPAEASSEVRPPPQVAAAPAAAAAPRDAGLRSAASSPRDRGYADSSSSWMIVTPNGLNVRAAKDKNAKVLSTRKPGAVMQGTQEGDWLKLTGDQGFMRIKDGQKVFMEKAIVETKQPPKRGCWKVLAEHLSGRCLETSLVVLGIAYWAVTALLGVYAFRYAIEHDDWNNFWDFSNNLHDVAAGLLLAWAACVGIYFELRKVWARDVRRIELKEGLREVRWMYYCEPLLNSALFICGGVFISVGPWVEESDALDRSVTIFGRVLALLGCVLALFRTVVSCMHVRDKDDYEPIPDSVRPLEHSTNRRGSAGRRGASTDDEEEARQQEAQQPFQWNNIGEFGRVQ